MTEDDRREFADSQRRRSADLAADVALQHAADEATRLADEHDYSYVWNWLGLPIIQMPTDIVAMQEIIWEARPQVIVETGVARGGSVVLHSSMLELIGEGHVVAVDIDIRAHNRMAIESHPLAHRIRLIEGGSVDPATLAQVRDEIGEAARVMVVLDSNHTHEHVLQELRCYSPMVTAGQFIVVADTMVERLPPQKHRPRPWGPGDNPATAVTQFLAETSDFEPDPFVNGKLLMSSSPGGYLRRR